MLSEAKMPDGMLSAANMPSGMRNWTKRFHVEEDGFEPVTAEVIYTYIDLHAKLLQDKGPHGPHWYEFYERIQDQHGPKGLTAICRAIHYPDVINSPELKRRPE